MFGKAMFGIAQNLTHRFNLAGVGVDYYSSHQLSLIRFTLLLASLLLLPTFLPAQTQMQVVIGHNRLALLNTLNNFIDPQRFFSQPSAESSTTFRMPPLGSIHCDPHDPNSRTTWCEFTVPPFPHHGIIMWINHDSGWQPVAIDEQEGPLWRPLNVNNGTNIVYFDDPNDPSDQPRAYRVYILAYDPQRYWDYSRYFSYFIFVPYSEQPSDQSLWEQRTKVERELIVYIDAYKYYWQLCHQNWSSHSHPSECHTCCENGTGWVPREGWDGRPCCENGTCWVRREGWDGRPDFNGEYGLPHYCGWFYFPGCPIEQRWHWLCYGRSDLYADIRVRLLFKGKVTSLPITSDIPQSADAAVDNRPVCPNPEQPPTFAKFGNYTLLGGLFVGQVPWWYGERWQTAPDLSGTGRTLLKFYNPDGFPTNVSAACLSLAYTATPYGVATSGPTTKPIGVVAVPRNDWDENSVSWAFLQEVGLGHPFSGQSSVNWIGSTQWLHELVRPPRAENALDDNGNLTIRPERSSNPSEDWERNWRQVRRVVIPLTQWTAQGNYLSLLLALHYEQPFRSDLSPYVWYYFLAKEHPLTDGRTCPRLWYVVKEQP